MGNRPSIDEAMKLVKITGKAAQAFRRLLEQNAPEAWFIVAGRMKKAAQ